MRFFCNLLILSFLPTLLISQEVVYLKNPSFEGVPKYGSLPGAWRNCAFNSESPPDLHPVKRGSFGVTQAPMDGKSYVGLVARDNSTRESIGQQLLAPLTGGQCYTFSIHLCRSDKLMSRSRTTGKSVNLNTPLSLKIWGGISPCGTKQLLAISTKVENTEWEKFTFQIKPVEDLNWINFEVDYAEKNGEPYNGNLLLDHANSFMPVSCETLELLVDESSIQQPEYKYVNHVKLDNFWMKPFYSMHKGNGYYMDYRIVNSPADIHALVVDNCSKIGFLVGDYLFQDEFGVGLKEIAVNARKHHFVMQIGLTNVGKELVGKRKKAIKRSLREIGFSKDQYEIVLLPIDWEGADWMCGGQELWIKLVEKNKMN